MPTVIPFVPRNITVHLGAPDSDAANVTVPFVDYVKNVASSEIYPTWEPAALRANIHAIVSFAINRVYTEFYRSRGYPFDITNSTAYDQYFVNGRSYFKNVVGISEELFNDYIRRPGFVEPLAAKFCNGTSVTCEGLSQWGSQAMALEGKNEIEILKAYYGDIEIVTNAPIRGIRTSYPGNPIKKGSTGEEVVVIQVELNRIAQNYPAIPKVPKADGIFGSKTETSVRKFQEVFGLDADGIVGRKTWYELVRLYTAVTRLSELRSLGQKFYAISWAYPSSLKEGSRGDSVRQLQYMLSVISQFIPEFSWLEIDGIYGAATKQAVLSAQRYFNIPQTGQVDETTWDLIYDQFAGIENTALRSDVYFPAENPLEYAKTSTMYQFPGDSLRTGSRDQVRQEVVR